MGNGNDWNEDKDGNWNVDWWLEDDEYDELSFHCI